MGLAAGVRGGAGLVLFGVGLILLAIGAILAALVIWRALPSARWGGALLALGLALYLPQFYFAQPVRVAHGILVGIGCLWVAAHLARPTRASMVTPTY